MIRFESDYQEGCHPKILQALAATNMEQGPGYGLDPHCERARELIRRAIGAPGADVHLLVGGTQTNAVVIKSLLGHCGAVVCADTGHIAVHESGAIEACGHEVITLPNEGGRLDAAALDAWMSTFDADPTKEHMPQPELVYVSHPTEQGTLYGRAQLEALRASCDRWGLRLFLDGARLGYGLAARGSDVGLAELVRLCDAFTIGGTKVGALFGEAAVFPQGAPRHFRTLMKQRGALLAKGRLLGIQFETLFDDEGDETLYVQLGRHADEQALRIRAAFEAKGVPMAFASPTDQQFPILSPAQLEALSRQFAFETWGDAGDGRSVTRFCTSWCTLPENVDALVRAIEAL